MIGHRSYFFTSFYYFMLMSLIVCFQPRILMAMARDGLLPSLFSDVNKRTQVPVKSTLATGIVAAILSFVMDVSQLAGMVSRTGHFLRLGSDLFWGLMV